MASRFARPGRRLGGGGKRLPPPPNLHLAARAANALAETGTPWYRYEPGGAPIELKIPGADPVYAGFFPRWLSQTHVVGILKPYAHPKARFTLALPLADGSPRRLEGGVVACEYAEGMLHAAMLAFGEEIDPTELCGADAAPEMPSRDDPIERPGAGRAPARRPGAPRGAAQVRAAPSSVAAAPDAGKGHRLLVIMADDEEWDEASRVLERTGLTIERAAWLGSGLDRLRNERFRAVVTDGAFDDIRLEGVLARLTAAGHTGPILVLDFDTRSEQDARYPAHRVVLLPLTAPEQITDLLGEAAPA